MNASAYLQRIGYAGALELKPETLRALQLSEGLTEPPPQAS
jgi:hypothetical protein